MNLSDIGLDVLKDPYLYIQQDVDGVVLLLRRHFKYDVRAYKYPWNNNSMLDCIEISDEPLSFVVSINFSKEAMVGRGFSNFVNQDIDISHLEKYFKYPLLPTEEECTLFEIEFGIKYPIEAYKEV